MRLLLMLFLGMVVTLPTGRLDERNGGTGLELYDGYLDSEKEFLVSDELDHESRLRRTIKPKNSMGNANPVFNCTAKSNQSYPNEDSNNSVPSSGNDIPSKPHQLSENSLPPAGKDKVPVIHYFPTKESLFSSSFWKSILRTKDPSITNSTVIQITQENSTYIFADSESSPTPFWKRRVVELMEIQLGERVTEQVDDIPSSHCVSSTLSSSGGSFILTSGSRKDLKISAGINLGFHYIYGWSWIGLNNDDLTLSLGSSQSITCNIAPTKRVQIFASYNYIYFPKAKRRLVRFAKGMVDFEKQLWEKVGNRESKLEKFGAVFFDMARAPNFYCVDDENKLRCGDEMDDPMEQLSRYSSLN